MVGARGGTTGRHDQTVIDSDSVRLQGRRTEQTSGAARRGEAGRSSLSGGQVRTSDGQGGMGKGGATRLCSARWWANGKLLGG